MLKSSSVMAALLVSMAGAAVAAGAGPARHSTVGDEASAVQSTAGQARTASTTLKEIYSSFNADREILYDMHTGFAVSGKHSSLGSYQIAMPFTPAQDGNVRKIMVAVTHFVSTNGMGISLRADANGLPGDVLDRFVVTDMAEFGTCCETKVLRVKGIPVKAGTQYWVVAKAVGDANHSWNLNTLNLQGPMAYKHDAGWILSTDSIAAFRVLGD